MIAKTGSFTLDRRAPDLADRASAEHGSSAPNERLSGLTELAVPVSKDWRLCCSWLNVAANGEQGLAEAATALLFKLRDGGDCVLEPPEPAIVAR